MKESSQRRCVISQEVFIETEDDDTREGMIMVWWWCFANDCALHLVRVAFRSCFNIAGCDYYVLDELPGYPIIYTTELHLFSIVYTSQDILVYSPDISLLCLQTLLSINYFYLLFFHNEFLRENDTRAMSLRHQTISFKRYGKVISHLLPP